MAQEERRSLREVLEDLLDALVGARLLRGPARIVDAKVPIIKSLPRTRCGLWPGRYKRCRLIGCQLRTYADLQSFQRSHKWSPAELPTQELVLQR